MSLIQFTYREMKRAWRTNLDASESLPRSNAHRLLLFYSIECGLKAVLMKRDSLDCTDHCRQIEESQHNINKLLDFLSAGNALKLPSDLQMKPITVRNTEVERKLDPGKINQAWRYGGCLVQSGKSKSGANKEDENIEKKLMEISEWIKQELGKL